MAEYRITFGQQYAIDPHPTFPAAHPNGYVTILAESYDEARDIAIRHLGRRFAFQYEQPPEGWTNHWTETGVHSRFFRGEPLRELARWDAHSDPAEHISRRDPTPMTDQNPPEDADYLSVTLGHLDRLHAIPVPSGGIEHVLQEGLAALTCALLGVATEIAALREPLEEIEAAPGQPTDVDEGFPDPPARDVLHKALDDPRLTNACGHRWIIAGDQQVHRCFHKPGHLDDHPHQCVCGRLR